MNTKEIIKSYVLEKLEKDNIKNDDDIFELGFVSSMFAMELVMFLEQTFNINIESDDLTLDNFKSIDNMTKLAEKKVSII
ncbi:acyl carrier protein [Chengkuizengella marina]|uniref:Acyl carrier protein n=1 Tax=Chengkuizengella marina TaxID=2507566 RepID=A0A6N9Q848_9BACL|nr:acyl carrier protein [Chengkuizengella marina]NBI31085.1 acyl carrier protein [Chengkuizengella marina]